MNLQRVINAKWFFYLLKYALKCEPFGAPNINTDNANFLWLDNLDDVHLKLTFSYVISKYAFFHRSGFILLMY